jgi:hypothetical protein
MTLDMFRRSVAGAVPPPGLTPPLEGLWWDAKGDWDRAHACTQDEVTAQAAWVHAYLHRKEGDLPNAAYWYRRAGRPVAQGGLQEEWTAIAAALLDA